LQAEDLFWPRSLVPLTALSVEENEKLLEGFRIGRIPEVRTFVSGTDQVLGFQLFEVMGQVLEGMPNS